MKKPAIFVVLIAAAIGSPSWASDESFGLDEAHEQVSSTTSFGEQQETPQALQALNGQESSSPGVMNDSALATIHSDDSQSARRVPGL